MSHPIAVLEIGTSEVRVLVAEPREDGHLMITGVGAVPSRGIRKSEVIDFDNALACVKSAIQEAENNAQVSIQDVMLVFSGGHIRQLINRGTVTVLSENRVIQREDMDDVMENARAVNLPPDHEILHSIYQHFYIDDQPRVVNPDGMIGSRLSLDMLILYGVRNRVRNLVHVAEEAAVEVADAAFGGLCSALAVLSRQQKEGGAIVIDLGAGTTDYVLYSEQIIARAGSIAVGGDHVTNDISLGLNLSGGQAERLKRKHGAAMIDLGARDRKIPITPESGYPVREIQLRDLNTIMHARMQEIFELVKSDIGKESLRRRFSAGVVLTGGGARMARATELASRVFEMPCHIGLPKEVTGLAMPGESPEYAATVGMLKYAMRNPGATSRGFSIKNIFKTLFLKA